MEHSYPRDLIGYGQQGFNPAWPNDAQIAVQFVLNYEEGGESNILHGDPASEHRLTDIVGAQPRPAQRAMNIESLFEYGSRAGFWRLRRVFDEASIPVTVFGVATALDRNPDAVAAMLDSGWEIACHGLKWITCYDVDEATERAHIDEAITIHTRLTGQHPAGWYTGATSPNTTRLIVEHGGFLYSSDSYADDLPYWISGPDGPHLIIPYSYDTNDVRFVTAQGFNSGDQFYTYLKDTFDTLYGEGSQGMPKMMSVGLHCRISGRPGRTAALRRFIDYVKSHDRTWIPTRVQIADHWRDHHQPQ